MSWRLIDTDLEDPYYVTAADEALAISCAKGNFSQALHLYRRDPPAVSIGYFRNIKDDVNIELCEKLGIKIVRRTSAGGSIYTDKNQLIFGIIASQPFGKTIEENFRIICEILITTLSNFGIRAQYKPPNDVVINGRKISGSAQVKKKNVYLLHGTVILNIDQTKLEKLLRNHKPGYISSIFSECGFQPDFNDLKLELKKAIEERLNVEIKKDFFTSYEEQMINELIAKKYSVNAWNFKR